jgi:hypothetical protein
MQLITLERSQTTKLFWLIVGGLVAVGMLTAKQPDPGVGAAGVVLALVAVLPIYLWLLGWSHGLPIWPVFALVTGITYSLPMIQDPSNLDAYSPGEIIIGSMTTVGFILLGTLIWVSITSKTPPAPRMILMIDQVHAVRYLLMFVGIGLVFGVNQLTNWIIFPGNLMAVARGIALSLNIMGLFVLAYYHGRGLLDKSSLILLVIGAVGTIFMGMTSLMLAQAIVPAAMLIFGYILGSNKMPWRVLALMVVVMGLLHPGKYEMRNLYWGEERSKQLTLASLPEFYVEWFGYGLEEVGNLSGIVNSAGDESSATSIFERAGSLHMLLLVQQKSPQEVPFFMGATYAPIPRLLIPRFLDDEKGISHAGNIMLTVNYGLQTLEQTQSTSIGWGLLPEAYANFGYLGVVGLAIVLASFYSLMTRLTVGVPMTSLRFVMGLLIMGAATVADTMGVFVTTQFQGIIGVTLASLVLMKRQNNPFAMGAQALAGNAQSATRDQQMVRDGRRKDYRRRLGAAPDFFADASAVVVSAGPILEQFAPAEAMVAGGAEAPTVRAAASLPHWAPRRIRAAADLAAQREAAELALANREISVPVEEKKRPRQLGVPFQNYRRARR